ncbi:hypothetical protein [Pontibacter sp. G13]|uniref:hypothetical protein n=1 Tax=Pontibacter sp. G13 TaxID=3074898 RepID=UPI0028898232|nr:hypothetical protein [Pontibacter sp. G13]WNJ17196.1 hypothetical protein RJD25_20260 [Pontibacter sp. G13]
MKDNLDTEKYQVAARKILLINLLKTVMDSSKYLWIGLLGLLFLGSFSCQSESKSTRGLDDPVPALQEINTSSEDEFPSYGLLNSNSEELGYPQKAHAIHTIKVALTATNSGELYAEASTILEVLVSRNEDGYWRIIRATVLSRIDGGIVAILSSESDGRVIHGVSTFATGKVKVTDRDSNTTSVGNRATVKITQELSATGGWIDNRSVNREEPVAMVSHQYRYILNECTGELELDFQTTEYTISESEKVFARGIENESAEISRGSVTVDIALHAPETIRNDPHEPQ